jgi:hypothetical protein
MEEVKRCFSFTFHWPPSMELSIGHQTWNLPMATKLGTFHWPPSMELSIGHQALDPPSFPFSFSLKGELGSLGALSYLKDNFHAIMNTCFHKLFEEANND